MYIQALRIHFEVGLNFYLELKSLAHVKVGKNVHISRSQGVYFLFVPSTILTCVAYSHTIKICYKMFACVTHFEIYLCIRMSFTQALNRLPLLLSVLCECCRCLISLRVSLLRASLAYLKPWIKLLYDPALW